MDSIFLPIWQKYLVAAVFHVKHLIGVICHALRRAALLIFERIKAMADGVAPSIRAACAMLSGCEATNFAFSSEDSPSNAP